VPCASDHNLCRGPCHGPLVRLVKIDYSGKASRTGRPPGITRARGVYCVVPNGDVKLIPRSATSAHSAQAWLSATRMPGSVGRSRPLGGLGAPGLFPSGRPATLIGEDDRGRPPALAQPPAGTR
jgi:hypothetical protein